MRATLLIQVGGTGGVFWQSCVFVIYFVNYKIVSFEVLIVIFRKISV